MAGSFRHCSAEDGSFRFVIENHRDAFEVCEEMFFMIWWLADGDPAKVEASLDAYYDSVNPNHKEIKARLKSARIVAPPNYRSK